jgi:hypothetical protein
LAARICGVGFAARGGIAFADDGIEHGVDALDLRDVRLDYIRGTEATIGDQPHQFGGREARAVIERGHNAGGREIAVLVG